MLIDSPGFPHRQNLAELEALLWVGKSGRRAALGGFQPVRLLQLRTFASRPELAETGINRSGHPTAITGHLSLDIVEPDSELKPSNNWRSDGHGGASAARRWPSTRSA